MWGSYIATINIHVVNSQGIRCIWFILSECYYMYSAFFYKIHVLKSPWECLHHVQ